MPVNFNLPRLTSLHLDKKIIPKAAIIFAVTAVLTFALLGKKDLENSNKDSSAHSNFVKQARNKPEPTTSTTTTVTPPPPLDIDDNQEWKTYTFPGFDQYKNRLGDFIFKGFSITYPQEANLTELISHTSPQQLTLNFKLDQMVMNLSIGPAYPSLCVYSDSPAIENQDLVNLRSYKSFRELNINPAKQTQRLQHWRLGLIENPKNNRLEVCQKTPDDDYFHRSTDVGAISIDVPDNLASENILNSAHLALFLKILNSIETFEPTAPLLVPIPSPDPLTQTFKNKYYPYQISYPEDWRFRKTYGEDIVTQTETDIISGFDLHLGNDYHTKASFVFNLLDSHGHSSIKDWIEEYDPNTPEDAEIEKIKFKNHDAIKYTVTKSKKEISPTPVLPDQKPEEVRQRIYFIKDDYAYRLIYWEKPEIGPTLEEIANSFEPVD